MKQLKIDNEAFEIDDNIFELIKLLNEIGIKTFACCEGHPYGEHYNDYYSEKECQFYIAFDECMNFGFMLNFINNYLIYEPFSFTTVVQFITEQFPVCDSKELRWVFRITYRNEDKELIMDYINNIVVTRIKKAQKKLMKMLKYKKADC